MFLSSSVRNSTLMGAWNILCLSPPGMNLQSLTLWQSFSVVMITDVG